MEYEPETFFDQYEEGYEDINFNKMGRSSADKPAHDLNNYDTGGNSYSKRVNFL